MIDLGVLDRRIARASAALQRGGDDPLADHRDVSGKKTYDALRELAPGPIQEPHRDALLRWVAFFTDARIGWELVLEETKREKAEDPALATKRARNEDLVIAKTWEEARLALFSAPNAIELEKALGRLDELAPPIVAVRRERRARSAEVAKRLDAVAPSLPRDLALAVLDATEPLARDWQRKIAATPAKVIESSFAKDATEGWPARLGSRWLEDAFRTIAPRTPKDVPLPPALGGASFLRAASSWGYALRVGSTAKSLPFALARDPAPTEAFLHGELLALAVASRVFARRKMALPARGAEAHERVLARTRFVALRTLAAITKLGGPDAAADDEIEHLSARVYGRPLPAALGQAWAHGGFSGRLRADASARFVGALRAIALRDELVAAHDEDWFDNPRAAQRLGHVAAGPIRREDAPASSLVTQIARGFEEAIG